MRRLALALALCAVVALAVPAAAAPMDPGRILAHAAQTVQARSSATATTVVVRSYAYDRSIVLAAMPSAVGDRPADGVQSQQIGPLIDLGHDTSFNLATIGARQLLEPAAAISP